MRGFGGIVEIAGAHRVAQGEQDPKGGEDHPHGQPQGQPAQQGQLGDTLGDGHVEGIHPGGGEADLGGNKSDQQRGDIVIAQALQDRYQHQHEGDGLLAHAEDGAPQGKRDEQAGQQYPSIGGVTRDQVPQAAINRPGCQHHPESPAGEQDEGHDADRPATAAAGNQALENRVEQGGRAIAGKQWQPGTAFDEPETVGINGHRGYAIAQQFLHGEETGIQHETQGVGEQPHRADQQIGVWHPQRRRRVPWTMRGQDRLSPRGRG